MFSLSHSQFYSANRSDTDRGGFHLVELLRIAQNDARVNTVVGKY